ncbi:unnamed protein product [Adineta ricciae]|uniref:G-protein coupled receptors family 1 profile domain-containing protein n=1 Tax=Adineta ricciae TaxID=249248 RepID=A0A815LRF7_ADIRI|nr:unnamed protein product [Adineta ricciae]CAF1410287.1 unnamed protein product [Adineta ricciae]
MSSSDILRISTQYTLYNAYAVLSLGILGNIINILVFLRIKLFRGNRSVFFLIVESFSNVGYEIVSLILTILTSVYGDDGTGRSDPWCKIKFMLAQVFLLITYFMIGCASADQFFSTHSYFNRQQCCTMKLARYSAFIISFIWLIHSIAFALFFNVEPSVGCVISNTNALRYATFFFYPVIAGFLPMIIAALFSLFAFRNVRRIVRRQVPIVRRRLDRQMTAMVFTRVIFFICLIFPYSFYRIYAINHPTSRTQPLPYAIAQLIQAIFLSLVRINSGVNFYIFVLTSSQFRRQVKFVLVKKCWKQIKRTLAGVNNQTAPNQTEYEESHRESDKNA